MGFAVPIEMARASRLTSQPITDGNLALEYKVDTELLHSMEEQAYQSVYSQWYNRVFGNPSESSQKKSRVYHLEPSIFDNGDVMYQDVNSGQRLLIMNRGVDIHGDPMYAFDGPEELVLKFGGRGEIGSLMTRMKNRRFFDD